MAIKRSAEVLPVSKQPEGHDRSLQSSLVQAGDIGLSVLSSLLMNQQYLTNKVDNFKH